MPGEVEAAQAGLALAKEVMPMIKDLFGMFKELAGGAPGAPAAPAPGTTLAPGTPAALSITIPGMGAVSQSIDGMTTALNRIAAALEKR